MASNKTDINNKILLFKKKIYVKQNIFIPNIDTRNDEPKRKKEKKKKPRKRKQQNSNKKK